MSPLGHASLSPEFSKARAASGTPGGCVLEQSLSPARNRDTWPSPACLLGSSPISPKESPGRAAWDSLSVPCPSMGWGSLGGYACVPRARCVLTPKCQGSHLPLLHFTRSGFAVLLLLLIFHRGHTILVFPFWLLWTLWLGLITSTCFVSSDGHLLLGFSILEQRTKTICPLHSTLATATRLVVSLPCPEPSIPL